MASLFIFNYVTMAYLFNLLNKGPEEEFLFYKCIIIQKIQFQVAESCEASSQPNSLSDNDVSSLPAVQEVKKIGFHTSDIVNAYREMASRTLGKKGVLIPQF